MTFSRVARVFGIALSLQGSPALAATITEPLPGLVGYYVWGPDPATASHWMRIDLETEFRRIDSISLVLAGERQCQAQPCSRAADLDVRFTGLNPPFSLPLFILPTNIGPFDSAFSATVPLQLSDTFLDGIGVVSVALGLAPIEESDLGPSSPAYVTSAALVVVGEPVPEPSTALLASAGLTALAIGRRLTREWRPTAGNIE